MTLVRQAPGHKRADWGSKQTLTLERGLRELQLDATQSSGPRCAAMANCC